MVEVYMQLNSISSVEATLFGSY